MYLDGNLNFVVISTVYQGNKFRQSILICIWEEPGSNLGRDTDYTDYSWFSSAPLGTYLDCTLTYATTVFFHILSTSTFIHHPLTQRHRL
jgi:hypothetical protein